MRTRSKGKGRALNTSQQSNFNLSRPKRKATEVNDAESGNRTSDPPSDKESPTQHSQQDEIFESPQERQDTPLTDRFESQSSQRKKLHLDDRRNDLFPRVVIEGRDDIMSVAPSTKDIDSCRRTLNKILDIEQQNTFLLREVTKNQLKFERKIEESLKNISDSIASLREQKSVLHNVKQQENNNTFYKEVVKQLSHKLFHDHGMVSDEEMKDMLKKMLEDDDACAEQLEELQKRNVSYDRLWNDVLYSELLERNRIKKGYYIRRVKDALWSTFGISRIEPFNENFTREQLKSWKTNNKTKKAYEDLYDSIDSEDQASETYLSSIVKKVFVSDKEQTQKNALWCQAILEIIFDEKYLSPKIETDIIDKWFTKLSKGDTGSENNSDAESPFEFASSTES